MYTGEHAVMTLLLLLSVIPKIGKPPLIFFPGVSYFKSHTPLCIDEGQLEGHVFNYHNNQNSTSHPYKIGISDDKRNPNQKIGNGVSQCVKSGRSQQNWDIWHVCNYNQYRHKLYLGKYM